MRNKPSLCSFIPPVLLLFFVLNFNSFSQQSNDSLYTGRKCKIVLFNGFEAVGRITYMTADSLRIKSEIREHKIVIRDIKYVLKPDEDVSVRDEVEITVSEKKFTETLAAGISQECDVYLADRTLLKDVCLTDHSDSSVYAVKDFVKREVLYSDIRKIVFKPVAPFGKGYLAGSIVGFVGGFIPFAFAKGGGHPDFSGPGAGLIVGLALSIPAGLIGGVIGLIVAEDEIHNFKSGTEPTKVKRINYLIVKHPK